jgi:hypothetical protein
LKDGGNHVAAVAVSAFEAPEISEQARLALAVGTHGLIVIDEDG